jgi:DNA-binding transcriptional LysR family regulator
MSYPRVSLEQWRTLQAVVEQGGFAQAAKHLHRSQSAVSYAVQRLQDNLGVPVMRLEGRRAVLTEAGEVVLRRARQLLRDADALENLAHELGTGWEAEIHLVVDAAFPTETLMTALQAFAPHDRGTRVLMQEVVLSGAIDALREGTADLVISAGLPDTVLADELIEIEFIAVAHPSHPLHQLARVLELNDLRREMQIVIRDSGQHQVADHGWLEAEHRWTVSSIDRALSTVLHGLGFAWLPRHHISSHIERGELKPLPLARGQSYRAHLYLSYPHPEQVGPATRRLSEHLREAVNKYQSSAVSAD